MGGANSILLLSILLIPYETPAIIVSKISLVSESNRTDYTLHGEAVALRCHYATAADETVSSVRWEWRRQGVEEAVEVYVWRPNRRPVARDVFFGRTDLSNTDPGLVVIQQAGMEHYGKYRCVVQTNVMSDASSEFQLIVIVDACGDSVWQTRLDMETCTESVRMRCVGLFPKPSASCGVFDHVSRTFLTITPFDRVVTLPNGTYEITLHTTFFVRDWSSYTDITFKCFFVIDKTSWRRGITYKLFGDYGCDPLPSVHGASNISEEKSCWNRPREGATISYSCNNMRALRGPDVLICRNGSWVPESTSWPVNSIPFCSMAHNIKYAALVFWPLTTTAIMHTLFFKV